MDGQKRKLKKCSMYIFYGDKKWSRFSKHVRYDKPLDWINPFILIPYWFFWFNYNLDIFIIYYIHLNH